MHLILKPKYSISIFFIKMPYKPCKFNSLSSCNATQHGQNVAVAQSPQIEPILFKVLKHL